MTSAPSISWTNKSVLALAEKADPIDVIEEAARALVLKARESGWEGPPFNPLHIVEMLGARVEANSSISDARLVATEAGPKIEFNPRQPRERVRFSIAHEVAHLLFPDWSDEIRNRVKADRSKDVWQLEMLCNLAASEFVLPIGSLSAATTIPSIEELMVERREFDVSAEAFLIRLARVATQPIAVFFASPITDQEGKRYYKVDYSVNSPVAPNIKLAGERIPDTSVVHSCTAIGYTASEIENWVNCSPTQIECVGIPSFPGSVYPRVAGLVRFDHMEENRKPIRILHGNILEPRNGGAKIICQLVNDKATKWGGGVARKVGRKFPEAEAEFTKKIYEMRQKERLGEVIYSRGSDEITVASMIAQEGFGQSLFPRIRYAALKRCFAEVANHAKSTGASIHMPKVGIGSAGGDWGTIVELLDDEMVRAGLSVTVYELPPKRTQLELF